MNKKIIYYIVCKKCNKLVDIIDEDSDKIDTIPVMIREGCYIKSSATLRFTITNKACLCRDIDSNRLRDIIASKLRSDRELYAFFSNWSPKLNQRLELLKRCLKTEFTAAVLIASRLCHEEEEELFLLEHINSEKLLKTLLGIPLSSDKASRVLVDKLNEIEKKKENTSNG